MARTPSGVVGGLARRRARLPAHGTDRTGAANHRGAAHASGSGQRHTLRVPVSAAPDERCAKRGGIDLVRLPGRSSGRQSQSGAVLEMKSRAAVFAFFFTLAFGSSPPAQRDSYVAVLAVSEKDGSEVTALESDLEMLGVPYETTHAVNAAVRAPMVVLAGTLTNASLSPADRERLYSYVESGGVLFATHVQGSQFFPLFGVVGFSTSRENHALHFADSTLDAALH